jgi:hypothetical protein
MLADADGRPRVIKARMRGAENHSRRSVPPHRRGTTFRNRRTPKHEHKTVDMVA